MFRLEEMGYRGAIVGPEGTGKTLLLENLDQRLRQRGFATEWVRLTRDEPRLPRRARRDLFRRITERHIILLDGAEQMSRITWWRFKRKSRKAGGLIITSHRDGLLPEIVYALTSPEVLEKILRELLGQRYGYYAPNPDELFNRHNGNIRNCLREVYDLCAARAPTPADLPRAS